jgi:uncharacterized protein (UPF0332 family)
MISEQERNSLIQFRIKQANEAIEEVSRLIEANMLNIAVNRIYYGMFYSLNALALKHEFSSSKHLQLIGWFNKTFVKPGLVDIKYGQILRDAFKNRTEGDYVPFITYEKEDVQIMHENMRSFISEIEDILGDTSH